jgi:hypothetical protein
MDSKYIPPADILQLIKNNEAICGSVIAMAENLQGVNLTEEQKKEYYEKYPGSELEKRVKEAKEKMEELSKLKK